MADLEKFVNANLELFEKLLVNYFYFCLYSKNVLNLS